MARVKGKTASGFEYEIDDRVRKSRKTLKLLRDLYSKDTGKQIAAAIDFAPAILGDEQADALEEFLSEDGFCDEDAYEIEVMAIFNGSNDYSEEEPTEAKNS